MFPSLLLLPFDNLKHVPHGKGDFGQIAQNFEKLAVGRFSYPLYLRKGKRLFLHDLPVLARGCPLILNSQLFLER